MTNDIFRLQNTLGRGEFDHTLLAGTLRTLGYKAPAKKIHHLVKSGFLTGIKKGLYALSATYSHEAICKETLSNLIFGPSALSLEYALAFYGLIPERVNVLTAVTPKRDKVFQSPLGTFSYRYLANEKYREGIDLVWIDAKHPVFMAIPEKALADYVTLNKIRHIKSKEEAAAFLRSDLRIDSNNWKRFNVARIHGLNRVYKSQSLDAIAHLLEDLPQ
jgi:predicted transcriptional regulator of viral defense system